MGNLDQVYPLNISIQKSDQPHPKPDFANLSFGKYFSDHMFLARYNSKDQWHSAEIIPRQNLQLDPASSVLHYGQAMFEGMKAFKHSSGQIALFRPEYNWSRMSDGAERLCMQAPPKELFIEGIKALVKLDQDWIPTQKGSSLYIRPTLIGTEGFLGVRPSNEYLFFVILSPAGNYYSEGLSPLKIWVETEYLRAAPGGLGQTKAAANYAGSLKAAQIAKKSGYSQVLWLDVEKKYVEEVGTMNVFFVFENEIVTPLLDGTILSGGVRNSIIQLLRHQGKNVVERKVSIEELLTKHKQGHLKEIFGTGTAAIISPVGELSSKEWNLVINNNQTGPIAKNLYEDLTAIQSGQSKDTFGWLDLI
jgi:branched-chain amino acid aminotransferase